MVVTMPIFVEVHCCQQVTWAREVLQQNRSDILMKLRVNGTLTVNRKTSDLRRIYFRIPFCTFPPVATPMHNMSKPPSIAGIQP